MTPDIGLCSKVTHFCDDFSLVSSAAAPHAQSSLGSLKVTQQLQWTLMGHWGAVLHITGLLPLQSKRFQQSAAAAIGEKRGDGKKKSSSSGSRRRRFSHQRLRGLGSARQAGKPKINLTRILPVAKTLINLALASPAHLADLPVASSASGNARSVESRSRQSQVFCRQKRNVFERNVQNVLEGQVR